MRVFIILIILIQSIFARENPFSDDSKKSKSLYNGGSLLFLSSTKPIQLKKNETKSVKVKSKPLNIPIQTKKKTVIIKVPTPLPVLKTVQANKKIKKEIHIAKSEPAYTLEELSKKYILVDCCQKKSRKTKVKKTKRVKKTKKLKKCYKKILFSSCLLKIVQINNKIKIYTKDPIIRKLILKNPNRIAFDFCSSLDLKSQTLKLKSSNITKIKLASHNNYNRITIEYKKEPLKVIQEKNSITIY